MSTLHRISSKKRVLSILILVLLFITTYLIYKAKSTKAAWYNASWTYRQAITITNNGSSADYVLAVPVDTYTQNLNTADLGSTTRSCADGGGALNYAFSSTSTTTITLGSTPSSGCMKAGDEILVIQMAGSGAGKYEFRRMTADSSGNTLTIDRALTNSYASATMVQRVPNYTTVDTSSSGNISGSGWNGTLGGNAGFAGNKGVRRASAAAGGTNGTNGANYNEANGASSKKDFTNKIHICKIELGKIFSAIACCTKIKIV